ncbi:MAG: peptidoglycan DD-metalloendopeptidase family protein [Eubacterium sp.]|nr:peptidoglycan DD-metalloendopeptidase family protein [Eubacterium sp.]
MKQKNLIKLIAVLLFVSVVLASLTTGGMYSFAENDSASSTQASLDKAQETEAQTEKTTATTKPFFEEIEKTTEKTTRWDPSLSKEEIQNKLEQQRREFEAGIADLEKKLAELSKESKETEEYINTLDEKIGYLNEELTILDEQISRYVDDIDAIEQEITENQNDIDILQAEVAAIEAKLDELNEMFHANYEAYCARMRAVYVSGNYGFFEALLTCGDISSLFTRYEMIRSVSKSDAKLLSDIEEEIASITAEEAELNQKRIALDEKKEALFAQKESLQAKKNSLSSAQEQLAKRKIRLSEDRAESDMLFAELTAKNGMYTEFRNEDAKIKEAVEKEIADLIDGLVKPEDVTMAVTGDRDDTATTAVNYSDIYKNSDAVLNMTYPVPGHYKLSAGYPNYSNGSYHGGIDFPCPEGTKVVAAQSGIVISVKELNTSYGHYIMIYHGTDAKGRKIVTLYAHNSEILVSPGDTVAKGQQIAKSGSTGNSTGPHSHFEIRINNARTNPSNYLSK